RRGRVGFSRASGVFECLGKLRTGKIGTRESSIWMSNVRTGGQSAEFVVSLGKHGADTREVSPGDTFSRRLATPRARPTFVRGRSDIVRDAWRDRRSRPTTSTSCCRPTGRTETLDACHSGPTSYEKLMTTVT